MDKYDMSTGRVQTFTKLLKERGNYECLRSRK